MQNSSPASPPSTSPSHAAFPFNPLSYSSFASIDFSLDPEDYGLTSLNQIPSPPPEETFLDTYLGLQLTPFISSPSSASTLAPTSKKISKRPSISSQTTKSRSSPSSGKNSSMPSPRRRNPWTSSEDEELKRLYEIYGPKWAKIARNMEDRSGKQVRDRYLSALVENIKRDSWTDEEDQMIVTMLEKYGPQWCRIAEYLEGRTEMQVKNRYYKSLKIKKGIRSPELDQKQLENAKVVEEESFDPEEMVFYKDEDLEFPNLDLCWESPRFQLEKMIF